MGLFTSKAIKEGKTNILAALNEGSMDLFRGARWEDYSDSDFVSFVCDEENFGSGFKKWFGYGRYEGSVSISWTPADGYLRMEVYFGGNTISVATMRDNADFFQSISDINININAPGTNGLSFPNVCVSKKGVSLSNLEDQANTLIVAIGVIVDAQ